MLSESAKKYLNFAGFTLSLLALFFVIAQFRQYSGGVDLLSLLPMAWPLALLCLVYAGSNVLLALSWRLLLVHLGVRLGLRKVIYIYGVSLLAKYIPGNVFQFAGRQALGVNAGLPGVPLLKSTLWEVGLLAASGSLFLLLLINHLWPVFTLAMMVSLFLLVFMFAIWIAVKHFGAPVALAATWDVLFLALSGVMFFAILLLLRPAVEPSFEMLSIVTASYVIAWLAGLITPGAPAGIGIREVVLLALLLPFFNEAHLLTAIVVGRLLSVSGDLLFYLLALSVGGMRSSSFWQRLR